MAKNRKIRAAIEAALGDMQASAFKMPDGQIIPGSLRAQGPLTIEAAGAKKRFKGLAYSGGPLTLKDYPVPVVVDLAGVTVEAQSLPMFKDHDPGNQIAASDSITVHATNGITVSGEIDADKPDGELIVAAGKGGLAWELSIGAPVQAMEQVGKGEKVTVNGRSFTGPLLVARKTTLKEVSFVRRGADVGQTHVAIAAKLGGKPMFEKWLTEKGIDVATLTEPIKAMLQTTYDAEQAAKTPPVQASVTHTNNLADLNASMLAEFRKTQAAELVRTQAINRLTVGHPDIQAKAIGEGWDAQKTELEVLRANRPTGGFIAGGATSGGPDRFLVIQAAIDQTAKLPGHEKAYTDQVLQAAHTQYCGRIGLKRMLLEAAFANGYQGNIDSLGSDHKGVLQAAFSTLSLPGILSNTANKMLLKGFMNVEQVWRAITKIRSVTDFKEVTSYRLLGNSQFQQVGPDGKFKHASVSEESFTNQADTYGLMFSITRRDQINDDLGALTDMPMQIGRGAGLKLNDVFWTEFCDNTAFFVDPSQNYYKGSDAALSSAALAKLLAKFRAKTDTGASTGVPLNIEPKILLVPTALEITAAELMTAAAINTGGSSSTDKVPNTNIWRSKFRVEQSAYLDNANYGNSAIVHYLLAEPSDIPVIETCFLNGSESPVVETSDAEFDTLGIKLRGYFDFGVNKQDARGGVKSKGAA